MIATAWLLLPDAVVLAQELLGDGVIDGPEAEDVKAGWTAFALFGLLAVAVAVLGWSLAKQLRKAQRAADAGVYGEPVAHPRSTTIRSAEADAGADRAVPRADTGRDPAEGSVHDPDAPGRKPPLDGS